MELPPSIKEKFEELRDKIDEKNIIYVFIGAMLLFLVLDFLIIMRPQFNVLADLSPKIKAKMDDIAQAENNIARLKEFETQVADLEAQIAVMNLKIKSKEETPLILEKISHLADQNNVQIDQIIPDSESAEELLSITDKTYIGLPILIEAQATYHDFGRFINELENGDVFLGINRFKIASSPNDYKKHLINLNFIAVVYETKGSQ